MTKVLSLEGERQARAALEELRSLLANNPSLARRTRAMLDGEIECPQLENDMPLREQGPVAHLRVTDEIMSRADALIDPMRADPTLSAVPTITRAMVIRQAIIEGLATLEAKYGAAKGKRR